MKKRILLFTAVAGFAYVTLTSYDDGPALHSQNRTGAKNSVTNCNAGGCHSSAAGTTVTIEVDTATTSTPVTSYAPGKLYTIKIHGTNTGALPKFGFQFASVKGTGSGQTQAGVASSLPANVASHSFSALNFIEHSAPLTAATAGTYDVSFQWTAPAAGTGNVSLYCTLNAVNGNGNEDAGDQAGNVSVVLTEQLPPTGVSTVRNEAMVTAYPNPATTDLTITMAGASNGNYALNVYDLNGKTIAQQTVSVNDALLEAKLNTSAWATGMYVVVLQKDGVSSVVRVVKN